MARATAEGSGGMQLLTEETNPALNWTSVAVNESARSARQRTARVLACLRYDYNVVLPQFLVQFASGGVSVVGKQESAEGGAQQFIQAAAIVAIARQLLDGGDHPMGRVDQVFADAAEPAACPGTVTDLAQAIETRLVNLCARGATDIYWVAVEDEKGGEPSPTNLQKAPQSFSIRGVSTALRSANFWRESWRGKSCRMVGWLASHRQYLLSDSNPKSSWSTARQSASRSSISGGGPGRQISLPSRHLKLASARASSSAQ